MSGPVKPVFASPTGLTPEHTVGMGASSLASGSLIDNLITRSVVLSRDDFSMKRISDTHSLMMSLKLRQACKERSMRRE